MRLHGIPSLPQRSERGKENEDDDAPKSDNEVREEKKKGQKLQQKRPISKMFGTVKFPRGSQERAKKGASGLRGRSTSNQKAQEEITVCDDLSFPRYNAIKSLL